MKASVLLWLSTGFAAGLVAASVLKLGGVDLTTGESSPGAIPAQSTAGGMPQGQTRDSRQAAVRPQVSAGETAAAAARLPSTLGPEDRDWPADGPSLDVPLEIHQTLEPETATEILEQEYTAAAEMEQALLESGATREQIDALYQMVEHTEAQVRGLSAGGGPAADPPAIELPTEDLAYETSARLYDEGVPQVMIDHVVESILATPEEPLPPPDDPRQLQTGGL